jgi:transcriptional regulator with XRE-family HTH domain
MELFSQDVLTIDVGARLRQLRMERGKSMRALARDSGLSTNALSMIERGRTSPSVSTLYKLAAALDVPITAFFRLEPPRQEVVFCRAADRKRVPIHNGIWEGLGGEAFTGRVEPFMLTLRPGSGSGPFGMLHTGNEFALCLSGQIEYEVENEKFILNPGDSLMFIAQHRHRWRNISETPAQLIVVLSGFQQSERPSEFHLSSGKRGEVLTEEDLLEEAEAMDLDEEGAIEEV